MVEGVPGLDPEAEAESAGIDAKEAIREAVLVRMKDVHLATRTDNQMTTKINRLRKRSPDRDRLHLRQRRRSVSRSLTGSKSRKYQSI
jgi:hypothetical protein